MGRQAPVVIVVGRRSPHALAWLGYSAAAGLTLLFAPAPQSVATVLDRWQVYVWAGLLVVSGAVGMWAVLSRRDIIRSLGYEQGAMLINAAGLVTFAATVAVAVPSRAWFAVGMALVWAVANLWRAWQIHGELRSLRKDGSGGGGD